MKGEWVWPENPKEQRKVLKNVLSNKHMLGLLTALAKSPLGLTPYEAEEAMGIANVFGLIPIRQLQSLGFVTYKVNLYGDFGVYQITDIGMSALRQIKAAA